MATSGGQTTSWAEDTKKAANPYRQRLLLLLSKSGRQDSNLRPFDPQSNALPDCATARDFPDTAEDADTTEMQRRPLGAVFRLPS